MQKLSILFLTGCILAASAYQMLATDSLADGDRMLERHALEITTRNAAFSAFTEAKNLVEDVGSAGPFAAPGMQITGEYESASYRTHIISNGDTISIYSAAYMRDGVDTIDFSVSADVEWAVNPVLDPTAPAGRYLVLKAYHEK